MEKRAVRKNNKREYIFLMFSNYSKIEEGFPGKGRKAEKRET